MGSNLKRKRKEDTEICMDGSRNFGLSSGQITEREPLTPNLFIRVGTRLGTITAYYEHLSPPNVPPSVPVNPPPVKRVPVIEATAQLEQAPIPDAPIYYTPKKN